MLSPLPRRSGRGALLRSFPQPCQPSPIWQSGRPAHRPFRGLPSVHSRYGLHTRAVTVFRDTLTRRLQPSRFLHDCSGCLYGVFGCSFLSIRNKLWTLWTEGCAVGNALAFPTASAPVRRRLLAGELSTSPQPIVGNARGCGAHRWCFRLPSERVKKPGWRGVRLHLPSVQGQTPEELPHPHHQASMRNLAACDRRFDCKLTPVCVPPQQP
jgi:hypothetical protein